MWHDITDRGRPALWTFVPVQTSTRPWGTVTANNAIGYVDWPLPAHMEQVLQKCRGRLITMKHNISSPVSQLSAKSRTWSRIARQIETIVLLNGAGWVKMAARLDHQHTRHKQPFFCEARITPGLQMTLALTASLGPPSSCDRGLCADRSAACTFKISGSDVAAARSSWRRHEERGQGPTGTNVGSFHDRAEICRDLL